VAQAQPDQSQAQAPPNIVYIAIGSVMGCLVLMTIVVVAIVVNNKNKKPVSHFPTMMNVPTHAFDNPIPSTLASSRVLFPPMPPRD
jgi:hypothetical protein